MVTLTSPLSLRPTHTTPGVSRRQSGRSPPQSSPDQVNLRSRLFGFGNHTLSNHSQTPAYPTGEVSGQYAAERLCQFQAISPCYHSVVGEKVIMSVLHADCGTRNTYCTGRYTPRGAALNTFSDALVVTHHHINYSCRIGRGFGTTLTQHKIT